MSKYVLKDDQFKKCKMSKYVLKDDQLKKM